MNKNKMNIRAAMSLVVLMSAILASRLTWSAFDSNKSIAVPFFTEVYGRLAEFGTSDNWVTAWVWTRFEGGTNYFTTEGGTRIFDGSSVSWVDPPGGYGSAARTYISTGALFDSAVAVWGDASITVTTNGVNEPVHSHVER